MDTEVSEGVLDFFRALEWLGVSFCLVLWS